MGTIIGIARRSSRHDPMELIEAGCISVSEGLDGDYKGVARRRQVSLLRVEDWQAACQDLNLTIDWTVRRANLLAEGLPAFDNSTLGRIIEIGDLRLKVVCETDPCELMEKSVPGLIQALTPDWRGGLCGKVICAGQVKLGDSVQIV